MNIDNLRPFSEYSPEELREVSSRGGKASGEAKQERKKLKEELNILLRDGDTQKRVCTALIDKVLSGDARAFSILRDTIGEKEADNLNLKQGTGNELEEFRERWKREITDLIYDEFKRVSDNKEPLYGNMARELGGKELTESAVQEMLDNCNHG